MEADSSLGTDDARRLKRPFSKPFEVVRQNRFVSTRFFFYFAADRCRSLAGIVSLPQPLTMFICLAIEMATRLPDEEVTPSLRH